MNEFTFPTFPPAPLGRRRKPKSVVILGAGLAGLCAARLLEEAGNNVRVLEASDRPGGRVLTLRDGFSDGLHVDAGALFVPAHHTLTVGYAQCFNLELDPVITDKALAHVHFLRNTRINPFARDPRWPVKLHKTEEGRRPDEWHRDYLEAPLKEVLRVNPRKRLWPPAAFRKFDEVSYYKLLHEVGASDGAVAILRLGFPDLWGEGINACSALMLLRDTAFSDFSAEPEAKDDGPAPCHPATHQHQQFSAPQQTSGEDKTASRRGIFRIRGGNDRLPLAFAERIREIVYNAPVTRIIQHDSGVIVECGSEARTFHADRVICTLPFRVLRSVIVEPEFSAGKARAIDELPYTSVVRIFLEFRTPYWREQGFSGFASTDLPDSDDPAVPSFWMEDATSGQGAGSGILDCYIVGECARCVTRMGESERVAFALAQVERVFPGGRSHFSGRARSKAWDEEPWARGGYCWFKPGQMRELSRHIATAEGRIHFAGEHCSALPGWMQGALESGVCAAHEVNAAP